MTCRTFAALLLLSMCLRSAELLDIASAGRLTTSSGTESSNVGIEWDEERDVREIHVRYSGKPPAGVRVEYWAKAWPYEPPQMPSFEDPMDDPWQGKWLKADVSEKCEGPDCVYRFEPLGAAENDNAKNLPDVRYRRTLKIRLSFASADAGVESMQVYSGSEKRVVKMRIEGADAGVASVYNGSLISSKNTAEGLELEIVAAQPDMPGSHDATVVTVHGSKTFSFMVDDLLHAPISIPDLGVRVFDRSSAAKVQDSSKKLRVRQRIPLEPEQSYERASREIPPLDPWVREWGGILYLPLAPDSDWQKFGFELGGNVFISKTGIKAKGHELERLQWHGDQIDWKIGTGETPYYREDHKVTIDRLDGYLPVPTQHWQKEGLSYSEQAFATLLRGAFAPTGRDEETPAVLMLKLTARNETTKSTTGHFWLSAQAAGALTLNGVAIDGDGRLMGQLDVGKGMTVALEGQKIHVSFQLAAKGSRSLIVKIPCVSDLSRSDAEDLSKLDYSFEHRRVVSYWKQVVDPAVRFTVPEPRFEALSKSVIAEIHISTTKDPKTGLYMVPAASYGYDVFENESCYQVLLLDTLGQFDTAAEYLETMMRLQGSKNFPGAQTGSDAGVFHGAKIDDVYDYTASGYGLDHGTVLWTLAQHYFYSRDKAWLTHALPHMQKAIDWIEVQRSANKRTNVQGEKVREYGLLPASQLEDNVDWANWFSINAFAWAGMERTAEALTEIGNPDAARVRQLAEEFRNDLRSDILRAIETAPVARMQDGNYEPYVPVVPTRRFRLFGPIRADYYQRYGHPDMKPLMRLAADRDTLCGAVVLLILGVFTPNEPAAQWILDDWEDNETLSSGMGMNIHGMTDDKYWFSQGGMVFQANLVNPIQVYLWRHEVPAAIRNLYNDFVACHYPQTNTFTEEFHQWRHGSGPFYKISDEARFVNRVRDTLVLEKDDALWLAPGTPRRWLESAQGVDVRDVETFFGPVSYRMQALRPGLIKASVKLPTRNPAKKAWLVARVPHGSIQRVMLNGKPWTKMDSKLEAIELPAGGADLRLEIYYR